MKKPTNLKTTFSSYDVVESVGQGGNGYVYKVFDGENKFAAKILDIEKSSKENLKRFKNEYGFCSKENHRNIILVHDHGLTDSGAPFFIMPLFDGSIRKLIGNIDDATRFSIVNSILDGLQAAHRMGVIHRDIKPENILYASGGGKIVLADFGIARFQRDELLTAVETKAGTRLANFQYAAPEQRARNGCISPATDIYAAGLVINELFTGELALGKSHKVVADVSEEYSFLDPIIDKMLQQDPQKRHPDIESIKREIAVRSSAHLSSHAIRNLRSVVNSPLEAEEPLMLEPTRLTNAYWNSGTLYIELNHEPDDYWIQQLRKTRGGVLPFRQNGPENLNFAGNVGSVSAADQEESQSVIDMFKGWLPGLDKSYLTGKKRLSEKIERQKQEEVQRRIDLEEKRMAINSNLQI